VLRTLMSNQRWAQTVVPLCLWRRVVWTKPGSNDNRAPLRPRRHQRPAARPDQGGPDLSTGHPPPGLRLDAAVCAQWSAV